MVCTVETDIGITGIGEGGSKDTLEQCAGTLIGKDPFKIEAIWQEMYIAWFYPPGREKTHALGRAGHGAVGHQGQGARSCRCTNCSAAPSAITASATAPTHRRCPAPDAQAAAARAIAPRRRWTPATAPSAWAPADVPVGGVYNTHERGAPRDRRSARRSAKASARTATGASTSTSASTTTTPARLPRHRGVRAVLRRGSGARRARAAWISRSCGR